MLTIIYFLGLGWSAKPLNKGFISYVYWTACSLDFSSSYFSLWLSLSMLFFLMLSSGGLLALLKVCFRSPLYYSLEGLGDSLGLVSIELYR